VLSFLSTSLNLIPISPFKCKLKINDDNPKAYFQAILSQAEKSEFFIYQRLSTTAGFVMPLSAQQLDVFSKEPQAQWDYLKKQGCYYAQGYFLASRIN